MRDVLEQLVNGQHLSEEDAQRAMEAVMRGEATHAQIGAFLTALKMKGEQVPEIAGFARAMRKFALKLPVEGDEVIDTCGTGGDGARTFNVSTAAAIVAAAAGARVAKHGNRGVSSRSGSADVLAALGVEVDLTPEEAARCLKEVGLCFLFAPSYHGAMKHAMAPRRELGFRTVFNILGPLTNPAGARCQLLGTYSADLVEKTARVLLRLGTRHALVVHGKEDGLDELTVAGPSMVAEVREGEVYTYELTPEDAGLTRSPVEAVAGGDAEQNARIIREVLEGRRGASRDIVLLNAGAALYVAGLSPSIREGVARAASAVDGGQAKRVLEQLVETTRALVRSRARAAVEGRVTG